MSEEQISENSQDTGELPLGDAPAEAPVKVKKPRTKKASGGFYYITDIRGFLSIAASGLILPGVADERLSGGINGKCSSRLPLWRGPLPECLLFSLDDSDRLHQAVVIELNSGDFKGSGIPAITRDGNVASGSFSRTKKDVLCLLPAGAIPFAAARKVYMSTTEDAEDLKLRVETFENTCLPDIGFASFDAVAMDTDLSAEALSGALEKVPVCENFVDPKFFQRLDALCGMMMWAVTAIPNERDWFEAVSALFHGMASRKAGKFSRPEKVCDYFAALARLILEPKLYKPESIQGLEMAILGLAADVLAELEAAEGLELETFISTIANGAERCALKGPERESLQKWSDYCLSLVIGEANPRRMADDPASNIRRGLALFLMRPSLERLQQVRGSSLNPGGTVYFIASCLAALQEGFAKMNGSIKQNTHIRDFAINACAMQCNRRGGDKFESVSEAGLKVRTEEVEHERITKLLTIMIDGHIAASISVGPNDAMRALYSRARSHRYHLEYDFERDNFSYMVNFEEDRSQKVYITVYESVLDDDKELIRFSSPCLDLNGRKKLSVKELEHLLLLNASPSVHCRFALNEENNQVMVIVDQLLATNDWEEFEYFCAVVARVADEYEQHHGLDVY